jgi:hypothetical protein
MRGRLLSFAAAALVSLLLTAPLRAQDAPGKSSADSPHWYSPARYNPLKLLHLGASSANDQLGSDGHLEDKLTKQLRAQGLLPATTELQEFCTNFRELAKCLAVMHASHTLKVDFLCLKWDVTGTKPKGVPDACAGPAGGKAMRFDRAIDLLKPDSKSRAEANTAMNKARIDIRDAKS